MVAGSIPLLGCHPGRGFVAALRRVRAGTRCSVGWIPGTKNSWPASFSKGARQFFLSGANDTAAGGCASCIRSDRGDLARLCGQRRLLVSHTPLRSSQGMHVRT